jgi:hypothetical protein
MKSANRVLIAFSAAILLLVVIAVVLVLALPEKTAPLQPEDTPQGTVQRYILALDNQDYLVAYGYLLPPPDTKETYDQWRGMLVKPGETPSHRITLGKTDINGAEATVEIVIDVFRTAGPFDNPVNTNRITFFLKNTGGVWKISSPLDYYWLLY